MTTRTIELPAPRELKMTLTEALKARKPFALSRPSPFPTRIFQRSFGARPASRVLTESGPFPPVSICVLSRSVFCALTAHGAGMRPRIRSNF